jgi:hypothetical protein
MKRGYPIRTGILAVAVFLLFNSCNKGIYEYNHFPDPLTAECQVTEFHFPQFDSYFPGGVHYLFLKKYDHTGKVKEIICTFNEDLLPAYFLQFQLDLQVVPRGRVIYFITLDTITKNHSLDDTTAIAYLNAEGRPDSCVSRSRLSPHFDVGPESVVKSYYHYKEGRLFVVNTNTFDQYGFRFGSKDTVRYDKFGNPLSIGKNTGQENSYQYDYTRQAKQQFYLDDYMQNRGEFYLLQYLGYFPEITSPTNVRIWAANVDYSSGSPETNHQFDAQGRLISYNSVWGHATITWNCH